MVVWRCSGCEVGAGPRIPDSNPQIHGKLASSACPALPGLLCENLRLRTSQDGEGGKAGLCSSHPLSFKVLLKYEKVSPYIFVLSSSCLWCQLSRCWHCAHCSMTQGRQGPGYEAGRRLEQPPGLQRRVPSWRTRQPWRSLPPGWGSGRPIPVMR